MEAWGGSLRISILTCEDILSEECCYGTQPKRMNPRLMKMRTDKTFKQMEQVTTNDAEDLDWRTAEHMRGTKLCSFGSNPIAALQSEYSPIRHQARLSERRS